MPKSHLIQTNFTAGEIAPLMLGRVDVQKYANGAAQIQNMLVRQQGPLWKRPGTVFIGEVKDSSKLTIVQEWTFSDSQEYVLEIGEKYIRIWLNGGFVETFVGSGIPLELTTPYLQADLANLRFTQSADILYIFSGKYPILQLERLSANSWTIAPLLTKDGPYLPDSIVTDVSLTLTSVSASADATVAGGDLFFPVTSYAITATAAGPNSTLYNLPKLKITAPGHTFVVGDTVVVAGLKLSFIQQTNLLTYIDSVYAEAPLGNGSYVVETIVGNVLTLTGSVYAPNTAGYAYDTTNATVAKGSVANSYVEYRENNFWRLGRVVQAASTVAAKIYLVLVYKDDVGEDVVVSYDSTNKFITADHAGTFTKEDQGKYYRLTNGEWVLLTGFISDTRMKTAQGIISVNYVYPSKIVTVMNQTTLGIISSSRAIFSAADVGRSFRLNINAKQPWGRGFYYLNPYQMVVWLMDNKVDVDTTTGLIGGASNFIRMGAWSDTTSWPKVGTFHEQRLTAANSDNQPQNLWMSQSGDFPNFGPTLYDSTVTDACSINYTLASTRANPILWCLSGPTMLLGTLGGEYQVKATTLGSPLSPTNIQVLPQTAHGSMATAIPYRIGYSTLFVQRAGRKLFELNYEFTLDSYVSNNLAITSEHILRQGNQGFRVSFQKEPNAIVWVLLSNGTLAAMTYERAQAITAWHRHVLGGTRPNQIPGGAQYGVAGANSPYFYNLTNLQPNTQYQYYTGANEANGALVIIGPGLQTTTIRSGQTFFFLKGQTIQLVQGTSSGNIGPFAPINVTARVWLLDPTNTTGVVVESICSVSSQAGTEDILYLIVKRSINGSTKRYIEAIQPDFFPTSPTDRSTMWYLDCAQQYDGAPATNITGLNYLEGEYVTVVADGSLLSGQFLVTGGAITIPKAASQVTVGYIFRALMQTLPPEGGNPTGATAQGLVKRPIRMIFRFLNSLGMRVGQDLLKLEDVSFRHIPTDPMDASPPLFTGDWPVNVTSEFNRLAQMYVVSDNPFPLNILAVMTDVDISEA